MVDENQTDCVFIHDPVENGLQVKKKKDIVHCFPKPEMETGLSISKTHYLGSVLF